MLKVFDFSYLYSSDHGRVQLMEIRVREKHHCKLFKFVEILDSYILKFSRWSKFPFGVYVKGKI